MENRSNLPRLIVASNNKNKLKEFDAILGTLYRVVSMRDAGIDADIEEDGTTFEENALIKAKYVMDVTGSAAIADDSGLEVDALGGAPGVYSARYCGRHGDDEANNDLLLENLKDVPAPRTGRYVAAIALVRAAQGNALLCGRDYIIPEDVQRMAAPVLCHRFVLSADARMRGYTEQQVLSELMGGVRIPVRLK